MPADLGYDLAHMLGPDQEHPHERRERERNELIAYTTTRLRERLQQLVGMRIDEAPELARTYIYQAIQDLRAGGVEDIDIELQPNPLDASGVIVNFTQRGRPPDEPLHREGFVPGRATATATAQRAEVNLDLMNDIFFEGQAVPRTIRGPPVDVQGAMDEALAGLTREQRLDLATQIETGRAGAQTPEDEAEIYGRVMADAYARRLQELGLDHVQRHMRQVSDAAEPPKTADTTNNLTPRRKLEID